MLIGLASLDPVKTGEIIEELTRITDVVAISDPEQTTNEGVYIQDNLFFASLAPYYTRYPTLRTVWRSEYGNRIEYYSAFVLVPLPEESTADQIHTEMVNETGKDVTVVPDDDSESQALFIATALGLEINVHVL